jgi:cyclophilin family peptidyl-prolyl cis-trans isomerase
MKNVNSLITLFILISLTTMMTSVTNAQAIVVFQTTAGDIKIKLYDETIKHKENFIKLVKQGYYNGVLFHRVIPQFMIQTGDPNSKSSQPGQSLGNGGPGYTIPAELDPQYFHKKGALAAARLGDQVNPQKESSGSQFYIVQGQLYNDTQLDALVSAGKHQPFTTAQRLAYTTIGGTPHLDNAYTVFGEVVDGLDIVDKISLVPTDQRNRPISDIKIIKAYLSE